MDAPRQRRLQGGGRAAAAAGETARLEGTLERVVYSSDDSAWSVVRLAVAGRSEPVTAVGNLLGVQPGENLRLSGEWVDDAKYGEQFKVSSYLTVQPETLVGIERYLGSGMVKGIGPVMAKRMVACFGLDTLEVIESQPERLAEVEGIGPVRSKRIQAAWSEQQGIKDVMVFLQSHGVSAAFASRIWKRYGARAVAEVRDNPFKLATDVFGIGFVSADAIARSLGIAPEAPQRAEAGVLYALDRLADDGHVMAPRERLVEEARTVLEIEPRLIQEAIDRLGRGGAVVLEKPTAAATAVYRAALHAAEAGFAADVARLLRTPAPPVSIDVEKAVTWAEAGQKIELAEQQKNAVRHGITSKVLVITGGPGTGKTTLINAIIRILEVKGVRVRLCAPTGRAARRLRDTTGREAKTVHRLLEFDPRQGRFQRNADNRLETDLLIADEASMLDQPLAYNLLRALPPQCRLILVGDVDQLPSVGPGNVLADLIACGAVDVVRLTEIFRQAEQSRIVLNAHRVNRGDLPISSESEESDFFIIRREEPEEILETVKHLVAQRIPAGFRLNPVDDIQVLAPMNRGLLGTLRLNQELQALLNPGGRSVQRGTRVLAVGDKVMQVRNDYDKEVFNGDIGRVVGVDGDSGDVMVEFDGRPVAYTSNDVDALVLAYACSIHKSQGSEYPAVVIPLHTQHYVMLQRNLLYTGISRGKRLVVLVGSHRALARAVKNDKVQDRHTGLAARLRAAAAEPRSPAPREPGGEQR